MVDFVAMVAGDTRALERLAHRPGEVGKRFHVLQRELETMLFHEKKPVAAPGHVAAHLAESRNIDRDFPSLAVARNIAHGYFPGLVESCGDDSNRRFYLVFSRLNAAHVRKRNHQADGAVTAHTEIADVIKEDDSCRGRPINGFA